MTFYEFTAPLICRSSNQLYMAGAAGDTARKRAAINRRKYTKARDVAFRALHALRLLHKIPRATGKRRIVWTRILGHGEQLFDRNNLIGGLKPVIDAAIAAGLLVDDSEEFYDDDYRQDASRPLHGPQIHLRIEELEQ